MISILINGKSIFLLLISVSINLNLLAQFDSIQFEELNRTFLLHLPVSYDGSTDLPLLIAMHGGFGNAYNMESQSGLSDKADLENFIVVYPEGVKGGLLQVSSWNAGWCCGYSSSSGVNDVGFIDALLDTLIAEYAIDTMRIYATGMSNGGFMSYRLACELSHRIAAIAPVAASMAMEDCNSVRPVPVIDFHSYLDTHIPYVGGIGEGPSDHYNPPQDSVLNVWAEKNNCQILGDTVFSDGEYTFIKWSDCDCGVEVQHYATTDGGHSWPGGPQTLLGDPSSEYISATELMWAFFEDYSLDCEQTFIEGFPAKNKKGISVFPNPVRQKIYISIDGEAGALQNKVYSLMGVLLLSGEGLKEMDVSGLKPGLYLLRCASGNTIWSQLFLKE